MSFFSRFYDFEKFPGIPREKFPNSQFFPFPWEKNLGGKTETLLIFHHTYFVEKFRGKDDEFTCIYNAVNLINDLSHHHR